MLQKKFRMSALGRRLVEVPGVGHTAPKMLGNPEASTALAP